MCFHRFETGIADGADHEDAEKRDQGHQQAAVKFGPGRAVEQERLRRKVYDGGKQSGSGGNRQSDKALFVGFRGSGGEHTRARGLYVEARQAEAAAHQVEKRNQEAETV